MPGRDQGPARGDTLGIAQIFIYIFFTFSFMTSANGLGGSSGTSLSFDRSMVVDGVLGVGLVIVENYRDAKEGSEGRSVGVVLNGREQERMNAFSSTYRHTSRYHRGPGRPNRASRRRAFPEAVGCPTVGRQRSGRSEGGDSRLARGGKRNDPPCLCQRIPGRRDNRASVQRECTRVRGVNASALERSGANSRPS